MKLVKNFIHKLAHLLKINGCGTEWLNNRTELWVVCNGCGKKRIHLSTLGEKN